MKTKIQNSNIADIEDWEKSIIENYADVINPRTNEWPNNYDDFQINFLN